MYDMSRQKSKSLLLGSENYLLIVFIALLISSFFTSILIVFFGSIVINAICEEIIKFLACRRFYDPSTVIRSMIAFGLLELFFIKIIINEHNEIYSIEQLILYILIMMPAAAMHCATGLIYSVFRKIDGLMICVIFHGGFNFVVENLYNNASVKYTLLFIGFMVILYVYRNRKIAISLGSH
jgi:hypothetical protein